MTTEQAKISAAIGFLEALADRLDGWAMQSRSGGWSTHQVAENNKTADECRRMVASLKSALF